MKTFKKGDILTWKPGKVDSLRFWAGHGITTFKERLVCGGMEYPDVLGNDLVLITCPDGSQTDEHANDLMLVQKPTFVVYLKQERTKRNG
jgi:hypothetical protein